MTITDLLINSFWHNATETATVQIIAVDVDANQITYITIENIDDAYDTTREQTSVDYNLFQTEWTISEYDYDRINNPE